MSKDRSNYKPQPNSSIPTPGDIDTRDLTGSKLKQVMTTLLGPQVNYHIVKQPEPDLHHMPHNAICAIINSEDIVGGYSSSHHVMEYLG